MAVKTPELLPLFEELRSLLSPYEATFSVRDDEPGAYTLWSEKDVTIAGRARKEVFFAGLMVQKGYVGFYFMPVYADGALTEVFGDELLATLKGKSCFHLKHLTPELREQVAAALEKGRQLYEERGWS
jgi:hypothetical protein